MEITLVFCAFVCVIIAVVKISDKNKVFIFMIYVFNVCFNKRHIKCILDFVTTYGLLVQINGLFDL